MDMPFGYDDDEFQRRVHKYFEFTVNKAICVYRFGTSSK